MTVRIGFCRRKPSLVNYFIGLPVSTAVFVEMCKRHYFWNSSDMRCLICCNFCGNDLEGHYFWNIRPMVMTVRIGFCRRKPSLFNCFIGLPVSTAVFVEMCKRHYFWNISDICCQSWWLRKNSILWQKTCSIQQCYCWSWIRCSFRGNKLEASLSEHLLVLLYLSITFISCISHLLSLPLTD